MHCKVHDIDTMLRAYTYKSYNFQTFFLWLAPTLNVCTAREIGSVLSIFGSSNDYCSQLYFLWRSGLNLRRSWELIENYRTYRKNSSVWKQKKKWRSPAKENYKGENIMKMLPESDYNEYCLRFPISQWWNMLILSQITWFDFTKVI